MWNVSGVYQVYILELSRMSKDVTEVIILNNKKLKAPIMKSLLWNKLELHKKSW